MKVFPSISLMISAFILTGCGTASSFTRANTSSAEKDWDIRYCRQVAWEKYPEKRVVTAIRTTTECNRSRLGNVYCNSKDSEVAHDDNEYEREKHFIKCMKSKNYEYDGSFISI